MGVRSGAITIHIVDPVSHAVRMRNDLCCLSHNRTEEQCQADLSASRVRIVSMSSAAPSEVGKHPLQVELGVRVSLSIRVEDCGPTCLQEARDMAYKVELHRYLS